MRTESSEERGFFERKHWDDGQDRLDRLDEKLGRVQARWQEAREQLSRLEDERRLLQEYVSEARERIARLEEENRLLRAGGPTVQLEEARRSLDLRPQGPKTLALLDRSRPDL